MQPGHIRVGSFVLSQMLLCLLCVMPMALHAGGQETALPKKVSRTWLQTVQQSIQQSEYHLSLTDNTPFTQIPASWQAPNRAHDFRLYFATGGVRAVSRTKAPSGWQWGLSLRRYGFKGDLLTAAAPTLVPKGNRIDYNRGQLIEYYINNADGLEQCFQILSAPETQASETLLVVEIDILGNLVPQFDADKDRIVFMSRSGVPVINYGKLKVMDANNRILPSSMRLQDNTIILSVNTQGADYPILVDPLATVADWTAESDQESAWFGFSVSSAGDVNGDGYADVIIGAPRYDNGEYDEGRAFVFHGASSGLSAMADWTAESDQVNAFFGGSVSNAGDVNGDGYADVIIGALNYINGQTDEGRAYVYHGSASGLSATAAWTAESDQEEAYFGASLSGAGDVNGDGYDDVIVGARYANSENGGDRVFVFHGSSTGLSSTADWTADSDQDYTRFGCSVSSAGDVNGDDYADVIVGAWGYDNGQIDEGRAYVFHGSSTGLSAAADWTAEANQADAQFGYSVSSAGDVNGDGYADVIVGAPHLDSNGTERVFVFHGASSGLSTTANWAAESDYAGADEFGSIVSSAGDVNGDSYADVIVGASTYDVEGRAFVFHGASSGLSDKADWTAEANQAFARFGLSVSGAGDVNGDGYADVIVGAPFYANGQAGEGRAFVYYGASSSKGAMPWIPLLLLDE